MYNLKYCSCTFLSTCNKRRHLEIKVINFERIAFTSSKECRLIKFEHTLYIHIVLSRILNTPPSKNEKQTQNNTSLTPIPIKYEVHVES